ncbi:MAG: alpha/beta hydrolase [Burkholderiaceae bacterium]
MPTPTSPHRRLTLFAALTALFTPLLQACSPLRIINQLVPSDTYKANFDQAYGSQSRQQLDVYQPVSAAQGAPVVVFFYGGSWTTGERRDYLFVGEALASRGIVVMVADYRLSPEVRYPVFLQDCALSMRWARDNAVRFGGDPAKLFVMGHSAGAYNAAMLALDPRWLAGVGMTPAQLAGWVGVAGPYDFLPIGVPDVQVAFSWPNTPPDSQPLFHAKAASPRALLLAARSDTIVNPQRSTVGLSERLRGLGVAVDAELLDGVSHTTIIGALARPLRGLAPVLERVARFVNGG